jgi:peroxiredoxin Q/BCP
MLNVGDKAPEFSLLDQDGVKRALKEFAGKKLVLYFFPKANTPG